jgi:hypothetical protein
MTRNSIIVASENRTAANTSGSNQILLIEECNSGLGLALDDYSLQAKAISLPAKAVAPPSRQRRNRCNVVLELPAGLAGVP